jgi:hypothetical protein
MADDAPRAVDFTQARVDLRLDGPSAFLMPDLSTARRQPDGVITWDPGTQGVFGGMVEQDAPGDHGGERHLDGDELIVALTGPLTIVHLDEAGKTVAAITLEEGQATLTPRGVWHRLVMTEPCRYLFFGGGRTEIRCGG